MKNGNALLVFILAIILFLIGVLLMPWHTRDDRYNHRKWHDASNLSQLGKAMNMYLLSHGGNVYYASSLRALYDTGIVTEQRVFTSPTLATPIVPGEFVTDYECILDMIGHPVTETDATSITPMAWNKKDCFTEGGRNVVFFDSHVEFIPGEENFQKFYNEKIAPFVEAQKKKAMEEKMKAQANQK